MCELFCFNSKNPKKLNDNLKNFYAHSDEHPHGWGLAYQLSDGFVFDKEPEKASSSEHLKEILSEPIVSKNCFAHIRMATMGNITSCNCHPFTEKDSSGRTWMLMHNGTIFDYPEMDKYKTKEKGDTDSERILYYIIDKINEFEADKKSTKKERFDLLTDIVNDLSRKNKVNLMVFDGELTYVHTNMADSLCYLKTDDSYLVVSTPIDDVNTYKPVKLNKLYAIAGGDVVFESESHGHEFRFTKEHEAYFADFVESLRGEEISLNTLTNLSSDELLSGSFGIEWEALRVKKDGRLALTPHPSVFGDKLTNPLVTTDFSESQIEIITPTFSTIDEAFDTFSLLSDIVNASLPDDEYLWFQSIPGILPANSKIPIAKYSEEGKSSQRYREKLAQKYGLKKQMISGVHFNFSFSDDLLHKLQDITDSKLPFRLFKDEIYLKVTRNYLRYCWLIIYLTGCSVASHETFSDEFIHLMNRDDHHGSYYSTTGPSFRNGSCGYKNLKRLYPSYESVMQYIYDVESFIDNGDLSEAKELYTQIRLKPKNPADLLDSLKNDGIEYVEIRTLDINPFYKCGLVEHDMKFLQLFLIYMLFKDESEYPDWQKEAFINEELTAERAYDESMRLIKDGKEITLKSWAGELINEIYGMCEVLRIDEDDTLKLMHDRVVNPDLTYAKRLVKLIEEEGYIDAHMKLSVNNKKTSRKVVDKTDPDVVDAYLAIFNNLKR